MAINVTTTGTITASITAVTISFTAPDTIADSGSGFGIFSVGEGITISGSASNDGNYTIATVAAGTITVEESGFITTEAAGASVTIDAGLKIRLMDNTNYPGEPIVLVHPSTTDLRGTSNFAGYEVAEDDLLGVGIDGGDVTMEVDGASVPDSTTLEKVGSGFVGDDAGAESLADTLAVGNTSGGNNLQMSTTDQIQLGGTVNHMENGGTGNFTFTTNKSFEFNNADSQIFLQNFGNAAFNKPSTGDVINITPGGGALGYVGTGISGTIDMQSALSGAAKTWTMPNATGTVALLTDIPGTEDLAATLAAGNTSGANDLIMSNQQQVQFNVVGNYIKEKSAGGAVEYTADKGHEFNVGTAQGVIGLVATTFGRTGASNGTFTLTYTNGLVQYTDVDTGFFGAIDLFSGLTADRTWAMPNASGTVALISDLPGSATESAEGIAEIATQAEVDTGTDDTRFVTPLKLATWSGLPAAGLATKSGVEAFGGFSGTPLTKAVTFGTAFGDALYSVSIIGPDARSWTVDSQTASGFTINSNSSTALTGNVSWTAIKHGETS